MSYPNQNTNADLKRNFGSAVHLRNVILTLDNAIGSVKIIRGLSLDIETGEAVGIIGPSGGGKSTMMMIIAVMIVKV